MRKRGGTVYFLESVMLAKDGSNIPILISASILFDEKGEEAGTISFVRDLRERKRREALKNGPELRAAANDFSTC